MYRQPARISSAQEKVLLEFLLSKIYKCQECMSTYSQVKEWLLFIEAIRNDKHV